MKFIFAIAAGILLGLGIETNYPGFFAASLVSFCAFLDTKFERG